MKKDNLIKTDDKIAKEEIKKIRDQLSILPLKGVVVYPYLIMPLMISDQRYAKLIDEALVGGKVIGLFAQNLIF